MPVPKCWVYACLGRFLPVIHIHAAHSSKNTDLPTIRYRFISYSEIELQCRGEDNSNLNVLTAVHLRGDKMIAAFTCEITSIFENITKYLKYSLDNGAISSVCVFDAANKGRKQRGQSIIYCTLQVTFWYNIDRCRGGADSIGLPHIGRDTRCLNVGLFIISWSNNGILLAFSSASGGEFVWIGSWRENRSIGNGPSFSSLVH